jgi:beta-mannosidase
MKSTKKLRDEWFIRKITPTDRLDNGKIMEYSGSSSDELASAMPAQVHEILLQHGKIEDPLIMGNTEKCLWVAESDWIYRCGFQSDGSGKRQYLEFRGLDTLVDIYLNGKHIASHNDMFIPLKVEVSDTLKDTNVLLLHFHSPHKYIREHTCPAVENGMVARHKILRKPVHDFIDFLGTKPYLTNIGVFDDVILETAEEGEIIYADIQADLNENYTKGIIGFTINGIGHMTDGALNITATAPDGVACSKMSIKPGKSAENSWSAEAVLEIGEPSLWWPISHGGQPLYKIEAELFDGKVLMDKVEKKIGFRKIEMPSPFDFRINGKPIKLWGANLAPTQRITNCWDSKIANTLLDLTVNAHMNILRVWGEGVPYPDELYDEADRRGILLWQDFYMSYGMHPDDAEYRELCSKEAEYVVKRLKNRASVLMWCGGNESTMGTEYDFPGEKCIGEEIYLEDFKKVCAKLDPGRYYHETSPYGGAFANDPRAGDTHGYTHIWFVPGADYPVMLSENTRVSTPALKSLKRYLGDKALWPGNFTGMVRNQDEPPMPETWIERAPGGVWPRTKNIEKFYDADNAEDLIYRMGSAHARHLRETVERSRRGRPAVDNSGYRICKGHTVWKLNEPYPAFYSSMIDYYLEPYIPYYALRRANEPVMLSFDIGNDIYLWLVNDSRDAAEGTVVCSLFNPRTNQVIKEIRKDAVILPDESKVIFRLDDFGQFKRENFLYARFEDKNGNTITRTNDYVDHERYLYFPDAKPELRLENNEIVVSTDRFARCIELSGDENGNEFGWIFQDNYFDLMPWEIKRIKVTGSHSKGRITAKARFSSLSAGLDFKRSR